MTTENINVLQSQTPQQTQQQTETFQSCRPLIVLDLDSTLIYATETQKFDFDKEKEKAEQFTWHDMDGIFIVFERPNLQKFLDYIFANCDVAVWTAATKDYAIFVCDKCLKINNNNRKLKYLFFRYHCSLSEKEKKSSKALSMFWDVYKLPDANKNNTIIIDDYDEIRNTQPKNVIYVGSKNTLFEYDMENSENDDVLLKIQKKIEECVESCKNGKSVQDINLNID